MIQAIYADNVSPLRDLTDETLIFNVPKAWPVFVLEDTADRIAWFRQQIPHAVIATSCAEGLRILSTQEFKMVFLDHDLGFLDAAHPDRLHHNGKEIARYLARTAFSGVVVIHSRHEAGANAMKVYCRRLRWPRSASLRSGYQGNSLSSHDEDTLAWQSYWLGTGVQVPCQRHSVLARRGIKFG